MPIEPSRINSLESSSDMLNKCKLTMETLQRKKTARLTGRNDECSILCNLTNG